MTNAEKCAAAAMAVAALVHLYIAPGHYAHAPGHGLFFGGLGVAQAVWALVYLRRRNGTIAAVGYALSGGAVVVWLLTQLAATPYALAPEPIDAATLVSKLAEGIAFGALLAASTRPALRYALGSAYALLGGVLFWGGGLLGEQVMPQLGHQGEHAHAEGETGPHSHGEDDTHGGVTLKTLFASWFGPTGAEAYDWNLPPGFPPPRVPKDNPMTAAKVELGRHLFYDARLSGNGTQSCASCHHQEKAFSDGLQLGVGSTGEVHPRNSMSLTNVAYNGTLTWANSGFVTLERQIHVPIFGEHPIELGVTGHDAEVLARFASDPMYQDLFAAAYPTADDPVNMAHIIQALASFNRALLSGDSPYDRFVYQQDMDALSESARRGLELVLSEDLECHHCHGGFNFSGSTVHANSRFFEAPFHNTGLYNVDGEGAYPVTNTGLHEVTNDPDDMGRFRAPTLRNVALTAPYMHDGSVKTLEEVIDFYERGGRLIEDGPNQGDGRTSPFKSGFVGGFSLTDQERTDLLNFLHALTDSTFITNPAFSNPFSVAP